MKINGLKKKALWENIKCCCIKGDVEHTYPLSECNHCKFDECWQSVPKKDFTIIALGRKTSLNKLHTELKPDINSRAFSSSSVSSIQKQFGISKKQMSVVSSKNPLEDILVERAAILF